MLNAKAPVAIQFVRGPWGESESLADVVVMNSHGNIIETWGEVDSMIYPRSTVKLNQALLLFTSGAATAFSLSTESIALSCASHWGQEVHISVLSNFLKSINCTVNDLECGAHRPYDEAAYVKMLQAGQTFSSAHSNCSGKHTGFLAVCKHLGLPTQGYINYQHPLQEALRQLQSKVFDFDFHKADWGIDGCGIPTYRLPLSKVAWAQLLFLKESANKEAWQEASEQIVRSLTLHPELISGAKMICSEIIAKTKGAVICKDGAEGVFIAALREQGLVIAFKIRDGAYRASIALMPELLHHFGAINSSALQELRQIVGSKIKNIVGKEVGEIRVIL